MDDPNEQTTLQECATCGNIGIGTGSIRCCDGEMDPAQQISAIDEPTLEDVMSTVFGMSATELEICLCVMEDGDITVKELGDQIGYDRSVVARHLNHLAELGVIDKQRRILEQGGHTYVYKPVPPETVSQRLTAAFFTWVLGATRQLESIERQKVESIADTGDTPAWEIFR